jgi:uncharacterized protein YdeI (YjbR/CyaY-like superfamily)
VELPTFPFAGKKQWADWLAGQHKKSAGVWLKLAKKKAEIASVTYDEAVEVALCYGWIDGQKKSFETNTGSRNSRHADQRASGPRSTPKKRRD